MIRDVKSPQYAKLLAGLKIPEITVGIHNAEGSAVHSDEQTILDIAQIHEFGAGHIPQRSFLRAWFDENQSKFEATAAKELLAILEDGNVTFHAERVALWAQGQIQKRIAAGIDPANAERTILAKGSSTPLIDKGLLRSSILGKVSA